VRSPIFDIAVFFAVFLIGCTVPIGPGFQHSTRKDAINEVAAGSASSSHSVSERIHIRVSDDLENIGIGPLSYLDVNTPAGSSFAVTNLTSRVNGRAVETVRVNGEPDAPVRVRFTDSWKPKENRTIVTEYDLDPKLVGDGAVSASADDFYITDPDAFPTWRPPFGVFVNADLRAHVESLEFALPADFRVLASGREKRTNKNTSTMREFQVAPTDFLPFAIAGRYQETGVAAQSGRVIFWTLDSLDLKLAQPAAERLANTASEYARLFGPVEGAKSRAKLGTKSRHSVVWPIYIAETSAVLPPIIALLDDGEAGTTAGASALSFPEGALLDQHAFARGIDSEPVLQLAEYELAQTWFGWRVQVRPGTEPLLRDGIALFAVAEAAGAREGDPGRRREISRLIDSFDRAFRKTPVRTAPGDEQNVALAPRAARTPEQRATAARKAALFLVAISDLIGKQNFETALRRLFRDRAGESVDDTDLRSALEDASGRDLAALFREWRSPSNIPGDFRARYRPQP
jgi:Peptidase family M1 domain